MSSFPGSGVLSRREENIVRSQCRKSSDSLDVRSRQVWHSMLSDDSSNMAPENTLRSEEAVVDATVIEFSISERSSLQFMDGYQRGLGGGTSAISTVVLRIVPLMVTTHELSRVLEP